VLAQEATGANERIDDFQAETDLHALGYQITGRSRNKRWAVLTQEAIPQLGLQDVAYTIAMLVRLRKAQRNGRERFSHAIAEWEYDLSRLKDTYYTAAAYRFPWPTTEP
jgi:hypothetical protein